MSPKTLEQNPLIKLESLGQSIWLDYIHKNILNSGELRRMIEEDGLSGLTSNPAIFEKAIAEGDDYDEAIQQLALASKTTEEIYRSLVVSDIQEAADLLRPVYEQSEGKDGYVSLEVSPKYALDAYQTIKEGRVLWQMVNRPNLMLKVPGTQACLPAIRQLAHAGINVNVTLLFSLERYCEVAWAYLAGLEDRVAHSLPIDRTVSVASFFLSRIDVLVDSRLEKKMHPGDPQNDVARMLHGQTAISSAKVAYQIFHEIFKGERFQKLKELGAVPQRLLWASTSTKNQFESDIKYVDALIGPQTINTLPLKTFNAYRDHGNPALRLQDDLAHAQQVMEQLAEVGININYITHQLEEEGIQKFVEPFDKLMRTIEAKRVAGKGTP